MEKKEKRKKINKKFFYLCFNRFFFKKMKTLIFKKNYLIRSFFTNLHIYIYNGMVYRILRVNKFIMLFSVGCFVFTRKPFKYLIKKKKR